MSNEIHDIVEHENEHWSKIFSKEKEHIKTKLFSSYWWEEYYFEITNYINKDLKIKKGRVVELGSGSGKATLLLRGDFSKDLFDISDKAIDFAKELNKTIKSPVVKYIIGDAFNSNLEQRNYDLVWNIGVLEHYEIDNANNFCSEMVKLTKKNGTLAIGIPNFKSLPIKKAKLLRSPLLKWIPGYRLDNEIEYQQKDIEDMINLAAKNQGRNVKELEIKMFGNPLIMESPKWIIKSLGKIVDKLLPGKRFLLLVVARLD